MAFIGYLGWYSFLFTNMLLIFFMENILSLSYFRKLLIFISFKKLKCLILDELKESIILSYLISQTRYEYDENQSINQIIK
jgi:hypothetical protein